MPASVLPLCKTFMHKFSHQELVHFFRQLFLFDLLVVVAVAVVKE